MQPSTGQWASHKGEPAQLEQFSSITANRAVPLRFLTASAMRFAPRFPFETPFKKKTDGDSEPQPPVTNQPDPPPLEPINEIGRAGDQLAQGLLRARVILRLDQHLRQAVKRAVVGGIDFKRLGKITAP